MIVSQNNLNRMARAEDSARALRNKLAGLSRDASAYELAALADDVANGLQAIREALQEIRL